MTTMNRNMNGFLLYFVLELLSIGCNNRTSTAQSKYIKVSFSIDKKSIDIAGNYKLFLVKGPDTLYAAINSNNIELPKMNDSTYEVVFKYGQYILSFQNIARRTLLSDQNMQWKFGIQNRPFDLESGLLSKQ